MKHLVRGITKNNLLFIAIGSIIGSGWLFGSFYTAKSVGPASMLSWLIGGIFIFLITLPLAELATLLPVAGGSVTYAAISHGPWSSSVVGWLSWLCIMIVAPLEVQSIVQYTAAFIPYLVHTSGSDVALTEDGFVIVTALMFIMSFINMMGIKWFAEMNRYVVWWKLVIPVITAFLLLTYHPHMENFFNPAVGGFMPGGWQSVFTAVATGGICFSYFGFQNVIFIAGEASNPQKTVPKALLMSIFICIVLYVLLQAGFIASVPPQNLLAGQGWQSLNFSGDAGPLAGLLILAGLTPMASMLYVDALISPFGTGLTYTATAGRILYAGAVHGHMPKILARLNRFSVPWIAIIINFFFGMLFFLPFSGWQSFATFIEAAQVLSVSAAIISFPIMRRALPDVKRPFRLKGGSFLAFIAFYVCGLMIQWSGSASLFKLDIVLAFGFFIMIFHALIKNKADYLAQLPRTLWLILYVVCFSINAVICDQPFHTGDIGLEYDFISVLIYSAFIYKFACLTAQPKHLIVEAYKKAKESLG